MTVLDELLVRIGMDSSGVDQGANEVTSKLDGLAAPAAAAGLAAGAVFAVGISSAMDITSARSQLQNQLGLTEEEAARAGDVAGDVFAAGFGESLEDVANSVSAVGSSIGELGDFTDAELEGMSKAALGLAKRFDVDVSEAAAAAGTMISTGLAKDATEAFDVMTMAAQTLPKSMLADIPATVTEYGKHWARIGLDAKTAMGMMSQYVKAGGRDIDQAGDVLHEFARITSEESERASDALKAMGLPASKMLADIHKGGEPAKAALQQTIEGLRGVKDPAKQAELGVALFGDMAGEGASALWAMDPATAAATSGMDKAAGSAKKMTDAMEDDPAQQMDAAMRTLTQGLGEALLPVLLTVSGFMSEHKGLMETLVPIVLGLAVALGIMAAVIWLVNIAMLANPIAWIILGIMALIGVIVLIIVKWDEIRAATEETWNAVVAVLRWAWDWISAKAAEAWGWVSRKTGEAWDWISDKVGSAIDDVMDAVNWLSAIPGKVSGWFGEVISWISGLPGRIGRATAGMWDGIKNSFRDAVNWLIWKWNNFSLTLGGGSVLGVGIPSVTLATPDIPYLADGGVTTGPTLAMIGEGREDEAVLPLSKLDQMINTGGDMRAPSVSKVQRLELVITSRVDGGAFAEAFQHEVRTRAGGSVRRYAGEDDD